MRTIKGSAVVCALAIAALWAPTGAPAKPSSISQARQATAHYHDLATANGDGYGVFTDADMVACIDRPDEGAMGIHYVNGDLVGDGAVDLRTPEALVYEAREDGRLKLVAVEYVVFRDAWHANHTDPPSLFGREFELVPAGNRYALPPFYALHAWLWKHNPDGMFANCNPRVSC